MRVGTDIIEIERIHRFIEKHGKRLCGKIFTDHEWHYCQQKSIPWSSFAARFAAKEAVAKAFGVGLFGSKLQWTSIEVRNNAYGVPKIHLDSVGTSLLHQCCATTIEISLSHCKEYAVAVAIVA